MNDFESGSRKIIPAVLVYARQGSDFLMLHRNAGGERGARDYHLGKWNGLGGKFEPGESPLDCAVREFSEESEVRLEPDQFKCLGILQFPNFKPKKNEDWMVYVFTVRVTLEQRRLLPSDKAVVEGTLGWIPEEKLLSLNLWTGDQTFLPFVIKEQPFAATIWYQGQEVERTWVEPLGD